MERNRKRRHYGTFSVVFGSLLLPICLTLGLGIWMGVQGVRQDTEAKGQTVRKSITADSRLLSETTWSLLEQTAESSNIPYRAEVEIQQNMLVPLTQSNIDAEFAQKILKATAQVLRPDQVAKVGVQIFWVQPESSGLGQGPGQWLGIIRASNKKLGVYNVSAFDPKQILASIKGYGERAGAGDLRAYLITDEGRVVVHSQSAYTGASFRDVPVYKQLVSRLSVNDSSGITHEAQSSIDRIEVLAAYSRIKHLPMGIVVEKAQPAVGPIWERVSRSQLILLASILGIWFIVSWRMGRKVRSTSESFVASVEDMQVIPPAAPQIPKAVQDLQKSTQAAPVLQLPPVFRVPEAVARAIETNSLSQSALHSLKNELNMARSEIMRAKHEEKLLSQYESQAVRLKDPRLVAKQLVDVTSEISKSPSMFFLYQDKIRAAVLHADSGFTDGGSPVGMSFPLDDEMIRRIVLSQQKGELASLADHGPLARLILARTGVAHFEAWALTGYGNLGRQAGRVRLIGVLVVLQSSVDSVASHQALSRMLRTTGLIYENALLSL